MQPTGSKGPGTARGGGGGGGAATLPGGPAAAAVAPVLPPRSCPQLPAATCSYPQLPPVSAVTLPPRSGSSLASAEEPLPSLVEPFTVAAAAASPQPKCPGGSTATEAATPTSTAKGRRCANGAEGGHGATNSGSVDRTAAHASGCGREGNESRWEHAPVVTTEVKVPAAASSPASNASAGGGGTAAVMGGDATGDERPAAAMISALLHQLQQKQATLLAS